MKRAFNVEFLDYCLRMSDKTKKDHGLVLILAGPILYIWDFFLVQVYARVDLYQFSTVT